MDNLARAARTPNVLATLDDDALRLSCHYLALVRGVHALGLIGVRGAHWLFDLSAVGARARVITADLREARRRAAGGHTLRLALCLLLRDVHSCLLRRDAGGVVHEADGTTVAVIAAELRRVARIAVTAGPLVAAGAHALRGFGVDVDGDRVATAVGFQVALAAVGKDRPRWAHVAVLTAVPGGAGITRVAFPEVAAHAIAFHRRCIGLRVEGVTAAIERDVTNDPRWLGGDRLRRLG